MRNLFRLRVEAPETFSNQIFTHLDPGESDQHSRLAAFAEWRDRSVKQAIEPLLREFVHEHGSQTNIDSPGAWMEDLLFSMDAELRDLPADLQNGFEFAAVFSEGRSLYLLFSDGLQPVISQGATPSPLESGLRVRVKDLLPRDPANSDMRTPIAARTRLVRVFFEDEDRVVMWLPSRGGPPDEHWQAQTAQPPAGNLESLQSGRIIVLKEPAPNTEVYENIESNWPLGEEEETPRDRATMSYVALALVVLLFGTALFGMWRWQRIGSEPPELAGAGKLLQESVDTEAVTPSRVSSEEVTRENLRPESVPVESQAAHIEPEAAEIQLASSREPASLELLWSKTHKDWVTASPQVVQGRVVYGCRDGRLYAIEPDGAPIWNYNSGAGIGASPEVDGTRLFCGNYAGRAFALRALDGYELWARDLGAKIVGTPTAGRKFVFFQTYAGQLLALEKRSGRVAWKLPLAGQPRAKPLVVHDEVIVISGRGEVFCIGQSDGTIRWNQPIGAAVISNPVRVDELVVFGSKDGHVNALRLEDGGIAWRWKATGAVNASPASNGEMIFVGSSDRQLYALSAKDGKKQWSFQAGAPILSRPFIENEKIYFTAYDRHSYVLDAKSGALLAKKRLSSPIYSSPLVYEGRIYFGSNDGTFYCLDDRS